MGAAGASRHHTRCFTRLARVCSLSPGHRSLLADLTAWSGFRRASLERDLQSLWQQLEKDQDAEIADLCALHRLLAADLHATGSELLSEA